MSTSFDARIADLKGEREKVLIGKSKLEQSLANATGGDQFAGHTDLKQEIIDLVQSKIDGAEQAIEKVTRDAELAEKDREKAMADL